MIHVLSIALGLQVVATIFQSLHLWSYSSNGVGQKWLDVLNEVCQAVSQCLIQSPTERSVAKSTTNTNFLQKQQLLLHFRLSVLFPPSPVHPAPTPPAPHPPPHPSHPLHYLHSPLHPPSTTPSTSPPHPTPPSHFFST